MHGIDRSVPLFFSRVRGTRIPITPHLVVDVLQVPRIEFPDYPSCEYLRTVSRDKLMSAFYERPTSWSEHLFTPCLLSMSALLLGVSIFLHHVDLLLKVLGS